MDLGTVYGPYPKKGYGLFVEIVKYDSEGQFLQSVEVGYKKYVDAYNFGLYNYSSPCRIKRTQIELTCVQCGKTFKQNNFRQFGFTCSNTCKQKQKRIIKKHFSFYTGTQYVIPISQDDGRFFIIYDAKKDTKNTYFISANDCTVVISNDSNGIIRKTIEYDKTKAVRIRSVVGYKKHFWITEDGRLVSKRTHKVLKLNLHVHGYWMCATKIGGRNGISPCFKIHRLVAEAFITNPNNYPIINHIDGVKVNNHYKNLEWCTYSENAKHAVRIGLATILKGADNPGAKLTKEQVETLRKDYKLEKHPHWYYSKIYNISRSNISDILSYRSYIVT